MIHTMRALYHWLRLGYYNLAIEHLDPEHPDFFALCLKADDSKRVVDAFLEGRLT